MAKTKNVPGTVTVKPTRDGQFYWVWVTPAGTPHISPHHYETEAKARTAGRRFARTQTSRKPVAEDDE